MTIELMEKSAPNIELETNLIMLYSLHIIFLYEDYNPEAM
jgi:hypothetical protein